MTVIIGDGKSQPVAVDIRVLALYDQNGVLLFGAEQLSDKWVQMGMMNDPPDPDLKDIILRNGLPYRPMKDVSENFPAVDKGRVFSIKQ